MGSGIRIPVSGLAKLRRGGVRVGVCVCVSVFWEGEWIKIERERD